MIISILVADIDAIAIRKVRNLVSKINETKRKSDAVSSGLYHITGTATTIADCERLIAKECPDIVIVNTKLSDWDLKSFASSSPKKPALVTILPTIEEESTKHNSPSHIKAPVRFDSLLRALDRSTSKVLGLDESKPMNRRQHIAARYRGSLRLIPIRDVYYFLADQKYVNVSHVDGDVMIEETLKSLEHDISHSFLRVHRNALVSKERVTGVVKVGTKRYIIIKTKNGEDHIEISRRHNSAVSRFIKQQTAK